jgi:hypothetical protein
MHKKLPLMIEIGERRAPLLFFVNTKPPFGERVHVVVLHALS